MRSCLPLGGIHFEGFLTCLAILYKSKYSRKTPWLGQEGKGWKKREEKEGRGDTKGKERTVRGTVKSCRKIWWAALAVGQLLLTTTAAFSFIPSQLPPTNTYMKASHVALNLSSNIKGQNWHLRPHVCLL